MNLTKVIDDEYETVSSKIVETIKSKNLDIEPVLRGYECWLKHAQDNFSRKGYFQKANEALTIEIGFRTSRRQMPQIKDRCFKKEDLITGEHITAFSLSLQNYEDSHSFTETGTFLSAFVRYVREPHPLDILEYQTEPIYKIITTHLNKPLNYIGDCNRLAHIEVIGSVGKYLGQSMSSGKITILGNAEESVGQLMKGGEICVENAGNSLGIQMKGGKITAKNAGKNVGRWLEGGEIHITQSYISLYADAPEDRENISDGKIFYRGKQIFPEEKT